MHAINHVGPHYQVEGALAAPRSPQGRPVYVQAGSSNEGRSFAARNAEAIFTAHQTLGDAKAFYDDIKTHAATFGRNPDHVKILPGISPFIADTEAEAASSRSTSTRSPCRPTAWVSSKASPASRCATSTLDEVVPLELFGDAGDVLDNNRSRLQVVANIVERDRPTLRQLLHRLAGARGHNVVAGTPMQVADIITDWFHGGAADGFNVMPPLYPQLLDAFTRPGRADPPGARHLPDRVRRHHPARPLRPAASGQRLRRGGRRSDTEGSMTAACATPALVLPAPPVAVRRLFLLAFIAATSPLAVDLYLASFPAIQEDLGTTPGMVQLTLTAYLVGVSIGQPIWGPLSDRFGRRVPLLAANAVTLGSSVAIVLAPTIELLIAGRFVQALSAAAGMVIARAMISDLAVGYAAMRALSVMMSIHTLVPVVGPVLGGALATVLPWRGVLAVFAAIVAAQLAVSVVLVRETLPPEARAPRLRYGNLGRVLRRPAFLAHALTVGCAVAALMAYVAASPFVYQGVLGFSPLAFGVSFAVNALGMASGSLLSAQLARLRAHPARTVAWALPGPRPAACS